MSTVTTTGHEIVVPDAFCREGGPNAKSLVGDTLQLLRGHFSDPAHILYEPLRGRVWTEGEQSPIRIESATRWTPRKTDQQPAVVVSRTAFRPIQLGLGGNVFNTNPLTGDKSFLGLWQGGLKILCTSGPPVETELLAAEVYRYFLHFHSLILEKSGLLQLRIAEVSELAKVKKTDSRWGVRIMLQAAWDDSWTLRPDVTPFDSVEVVLEPRIYDQRVDG